MRARCARMALFLSLASFPAAAFAQWAPEGRPVSAATGDQFAPAIAADGAGGAFVVWVDSRVTPYSYDLYIQRLAANGVPQWTADGVVVSNAAGDQIQPCVVSDGAGGAIVVWEDQRNPEADIFAQRISSAGAAMWTANGIAVTTDTLTQIAPRCVSDGAGGVIIVWEDSRDEFPDIYGQRLNPSGAALWTAGGRAICTELSNQFSPDIARDGGNGAIVTWFDDRNFDFDIFAQRITGTGTPSWTVDGLPFCTASGTQQLPRIVPDGAGGAILAWEDFRDEIFSFDIYAQRINSAGTRLWALNGVSLVDDDSDQARPLLLADGAGGAIVSWLDQRFGDTDIFAQRLNATGVPQWVANGVELTAALGPQQRTSMVSDGAGGAIVTWEDFRSGIFNSEIYAQRVGPTGAVQWAADGVPVVVAPGLQTGPVAIADGSGGMIVAWEDVRSAVNADIYAQRIGPNGIPALLAAPDEPAAAAFTVPPPRPNPFRGAVTLSLVLPAAAPVTLEVFDAAGRRVRTVASGAWLPAGVQALEWDGRDDRGLRTGPGTYVMRVATATARRTHKVTLVD